jgi:hypothetical protein
VVRGPESERYVAASPKNGQNAIHSIGGEPGENEIVSSSPASHPISRIPQDPRPRRRAFRGEAKLKYNQLLEFRCVDRFVVVTAPR